MSTFAVPRRPNFSAGIIHMTKPVKVTEFGLASGGPCAVHGFQSLDASFRSDDAHPGFAPQPQTCTLEAVL